MRHLRISAAIVVSLFALSTAVTAQAADPLSDGLVRIDSSWARVKTLADDSKVITFANSASGQWMGEVGPKDQLMVRDVDDEQLVRGWDELGHSAKTAASATLTWNKGANYTLIAVTRPQITPKGHLRFHIDPSVDLPPRLAGAAINISRSSAPQARAFPTTETYALTSTAKISTTNNFAYEASALISDSGTNCYDITVVQEAPSGQLPDNLACGSITFTSGTFMLNLPLATQNGTLYFASVMQASGSPFSFSAVVASWAVTGS